MFRHGADALDLVRVNQGNARQDGFAVNLVSLIVQDVWQVKSLAFPTIDPAGR